MLVSFCATNNLSEEERPILINYILSDTDLLAAAGSRLVAHPARLCPTDPI